MVIQLKLFNSSIRFKKKIRSQATWWAAAGKDIRQQPYIWTDPMKDSLYDDNYLAKSYSSF